jgi:hypothetical protein
VCSELWSAKRCNSVIVLRLQTGVVATPAVALYRGSGYSRIAPFGRYRDEPFAVAFEKRLVD